VLEIAHAVGAGDGIETICFEWQGFAIAVLEGYYIIEQLLLYFFSTYFQHLVGNVYAYNAFGL